MKEKLILGVRVLLGLIFVIFGLNYFFQFIPLPPSTEAADNFMRALMATGYFFPVMKFIEITSGLLLLSGCFVPLALLLLAPILLEILLFHAFLAPSGLPMGILLVVFEATLAWNYREAFAPIFKCRDCKEKSPTKK